MSRYIDPETVKSFLSSKISFGVAESEVSDVELQLLVAQAESKVELDLSPIYQVPFTGQDPITFLDIPFLQIRNLTRPGSETTTETIQNLCIYRASYTVLKFFYGKTGNNRGESYISWTTDLYQDILQPMLRKRNTGVFDTPPLPYLKPNALSQRYHPVAPAPRVTGNCNVNSLSYVNRHVNDPQTNWQIGRRRRSCV